MWATNNMKTRDVQYSLFDSEDKENILSRSSDDQSENSRSEGGQTARRHSHRPWITGNTTGIVALLLIYGLSIFSTDLGTWAVQSHGNNLLKKTSACCKSPS